MTTELRGGISTENALRERVRELERDRCEWQARHQGVAQLFEALQASYGELQGDYRRLTQAHTDTLLAYGTLVREHRALLQPLTTNTLGPRPSELASGDCGIEFTEQMECNKQHCPTTPPHRHITPPHPPKMPGRGVPPCPDRINDIQAPPSPTTTSARFQATLDDDFGDSDVIPTRENPNHFKNGRTTPSNGLPPSLDINQGPPASNTSEKGGAQGNPNPKPITAEEAVDLIQAGHGDRVYLRKAPMDVNNIVGGPNETELAAARRAYHEVFEQKAAELYNQDFNPSETLQRLRDSARIASKFAAAGNFQVGDSVINANGQVVGEILGGRLTDASGEAGPTVTDPEIVSDCGFQAQDGSDETRNSPDKSTEDR